MPEIYHLNFINVPLVSFDLSWLILYSSCVFEMIQGSNNDLGLVSIYGRCLLGRNVAQKVRNKAVVVPLNPILVMCRTKII